MIVPTLASDLAYGTSNERTHKQTLEEFFKKSLTHRGGYSTFDYDDGATLFVELKSRRIRHDKYPTAIIGANKVATAREQSKTQRFNVFYLHLSYYEYPLCPLFFVG